MARSSADIPQTRTGAARDAGLSERQQKTAIRMANVPEAEFDDAVESDAPVTVTDLPSAARISA